MFRELESSSLSNLNPGTGANTFGQTKSRKEALGSISSSLRASLDPDVVKLTTSGNIRRQGLQSGSTTLIEQSLSPIRYPIFCTNIREKAVKYFSLQLDVLENWKPTSGES